MHSVDRQKLKESESDVTVRYKNSAYCFSSDTPPPRGRQRSLSTLIREIRPPVDKMVIIGMQGMQGDGDKDDDNSDGITGTGND